MLPVNSRRVTQVAIRLIGLGLGIFSGTGLILGTIWATSAPALFVLGVSAGLFNALSFAIPSRSYETHGLRVGMIIIASLVLGGFLLCVVNGGGCFLQIQVLDMIVPILFLVWVSLVPSEEMP